jgi:hypothetical protein
MMVAMKHFTAVALVVIAQLATSVAVNADAVADQKKAYQLMGKDLKNTPAMCKLLSKSEAERFLGQPMKNGESAGPVVTGCAYYAVDGSGNGLLVTRAERSSWHPETSMPQYKIAGGVGEQAYTFFFQGVGYEADGLSAKGVPSCSATNIQA